MSSCRRHHTWTWREAALVGGSSRIPKAQLTAQVLCSGLGAIPALGVGTVLPHDAYTIVYAIRKSGLVSTCSPAAQWLW